MGTVLTIDNYNIEGDFAWGGYSTLKYPYLYVLSESKLYRVNVITHYSELIKTISETPLMTGVGSGLYYKEAGDKLFFFTKYEYQSSGYYYAQIRLHSIDLNTYDVALVTTPFSWNEYGNKINTVNASGILNRISDDTLRLIYIPIWQVFRTSYTSTYRQYRVVDIDINTGKTKSVSSESASTENNALYGIIPYVIDDKYNRLVYGNEVVAGRKYTGYVKTGYSTSHTTLNSDEYANLGVFKFNNTFYAVGGMVNGKPNTSVIRINPDTFTSDIVGETDNTYTGQPIVQVDDEKNEAYVITHDGKISVFNLLTYDLIYNFYDKTDVKETVTGALPIKGVFLGYDNNVVSVRLTYIDNTTQTINYQIQSVDGYMFAGLSMSKGAYRPDIVLGNNVVSIYNNTSFYPVYKRHVTPTTTFDIDLYQNSAEVNRVNKTDYITAVGTLSGVLREECSLVAPVITFQMTDAPTFNYVRIVAFGRWYFVTGIVSVSKNVWRMSLSCDVLMTYRSQILNLTATIARQENDYNPLLQDSELPAQANQVVTVQEFPAGEFKTDESIQYPFVLTVVGA